jgi:hypothetical protein
MSKPDLVGSREIASRLNVSLKLVQMWRYRKVMPEPEWIVSGVPIWRWGTIQQWAEKR